MRRLIFQNATITLVEPVLVPELVPISHGNRENCIAWWALEIDGNMYEITAVSMGNPHAVVFMQNLENLEIASIGPKFENDKVFFPDGQIQNLCRFYRGTESGCAYGKEGPEKLLPAARELARRLLAVS